MWRENLKNLGLPVNNTNDTKEALVTSEASDQCVFRHMSLPLYKMYHGFSWKFYLISCHKSTIVWSDLTPNSMTVPCYLSRFNLFSMEKHDMEFGQVQVMEFPWQERENDGISIGFGVVFDQTSVKKTWENPRHSFYRVYISNC